jgi:hypothetical protein
VEVAVDVEVEAVVAGKENTGRLRKNTQTRGLRMPTAIVIAHVLFNYPTKVEN